MVAIQLDPAHQKRLDQLAQSQGQDGPNLARQIVVDYLDLLTLEADSPEGWAQASTALAPEIMAEESWSDGGHGPK